MLSDYWNKEYGVAFYEDADLFKLRKIAYQYHQETEDFDQLICLKKRENGIAQPTNSWEMTTSTLNARQTFDILLEEALILGFNKDQFEYAIRGEAKRFESNFLLKKKK